MDPRVNLRHLEHLVLLADELHFARAAERASLSQSAFSRSIAAFEESVGLRLFDRGPRFVAPTADGKLVVAHARRLLSSSADLTRELSLLRTGHLGEVAVGAGPFAAITLMARALAQLKRLHPSASVRLEVKNTLGLLQDLQDGKLDFFVADTRDLPPSEEWSIYPLGTFTGGLFCRAGHPLASKKSLTFADLRSEYFASVHLPAAVKLRLVQLLGIGDERSSPFALECENSSVLREYVLRSDVILLAPADAGRLEIGTGGMVALKVKGLEKLSEKAPLFSVVAIVRMKDRTPTTATRALLDLVRREAQDIFAPPGRLTHLHDPAHSERKIPTKSFPDSRCHSNPGLS
jgi:DNA-binding transcriptional LysR family regulator